MNFIIFFLVSISLLFYSCIPAAHQTKSYKKGEQLESKLKLELSRLHQEYKLWENKEREFLKQIDINEAQAYSNYKEALNILNHDHDQSKPIIAQKQLRAVYETSPQKKELFTISIKLAHKLSSLKSDITFTENMLNGFYKDRERFLLNYPK